MLRGAMKGKGKVEAGSLVKGIKEMIFVLLAHQNKAEESNKEYILRSRQIFAQG